MSELVQAIESVTPPKSYRELLIRFNNKNNHEGLPKGELLTFNVENDALAVYNPAPVVIDGQQYLWSRVEERTTEKDSTVRLFKEGKNGEWNVVEGAPTFRRLQDPFYCGMINGYHILGGVQVYDVEGTPDLGYRTVFYRYRNSFTELVNPNGKIRDPFAVGPGKMKGIRLIQIEKGRIGVFTRPQGPRGQFGGRGRVGYFEIQSLDQLESALADYDRQKDPNTLIHGLFVDDGQGDEEWGGVNELHLLPDGKIGVLGHIAGFGDKRYITANGKREAKKDYHPITFIFDPKTLSVSDVQIVATTEQFPHVEVKKDELGNLFYSGGLVRLGNGDAWLYVGIGDSNVGRILINDPFEG